MMKTNIPSHTLSVWTLLRFISLSSTSLSLTRSLSLTHTHSLPLFFSNCYKRDFADLSELLVYWITFQHRLSVVAIGKCVENMRYQSTNSDWLRLRILLWRKKENKFDKYSTDTRALVFSSLLNPNDVIKREFFFVFSLLLSLSRSFHFFFFLCVCMCLCVPHEGNITSGRA